MKKMKMALFPRACVWMMLSLFVAAPSFSAVFIYVNGLVGESADKDHAGWSDVDNWRFEIGGATATTRAPSFTHITFVKEMDSMSNGLAEAALMGKVFPDVTLHMTASYTDVGRVVFYEIVLTNVRVTSYDVEGTGNVEAGPPTEEVKLSFELATIKYHQNSLTGARQKTVEFSWRAR